jgi:hypothetical protein
MKSAPSKAKRSAAPAIRLLWMRGLAAVLLVSPLGAGTDARAADGEILYQQKLPSYPFQPIVPLTIGGKNYPFMFDTGTYAPIFDPSLRGLLGIIVEKGELQSFGVVTETDIYNAPPMNLGRLKLPAWLAATKNYAIHRTVSGAEIRGIMGIKPLDQYSIWFDFDHESLKIVKEMTAPPAGMTPLDLRFSGQGTSPKFELDLQGRKLLFLEDTGFNGFIGLEHNVFAKFVTEGVISQAPAPDAKLSGEQYGGKTFAKGWFRDGTLLGMELKGVPVMDSVNVNHLGMSFLVYFNNILDLAGKKFYYERRKDFGLLLQEKMLGAVILFPERRNIVYSLYMGQSAARDAGIREGDHITRIGSLTDREMNAVSLYELCLHHYNEVMEVEVERPGEPNAFVTHLLMPRRQYAFPAMPAPGPPTPAPPTPAPPTPAPPTPAPPGNPPPQPSR